MKYNTEAVVRPDYRPERFDSYWGLDKCWIYHGEVETENRANTESHKGSRNSIGLRPCRVQEKI